MYISRALLGTPENEVLECLTTSVHTRQANFLANFLGAQTVGALNLSQYARDSKTGITHIVVYRLIIVVVLAC